VPDGDGRAAAAEPPVKSKGSPFSLAELFAREDLAKAAGAAGVALYAILFFAYREYYDALGISPEDVGVTNSFVLVRSAGFILISIGVGAAVAGYLFASSGYSAGPLQTSDVVRGVATLVLCAALGYYFAKLFPTSTLQFVPLLLAATPLPLGPLVNRLRQKRDDRRWVSALVASTTLVAIVIPAAGVARQAAELGRQAKAGVAVQPISVLTIPIVDVSAPKVQVYWANQSIPPPVAIFSAGTGRPVQGTLLGQTSSIVVVNLETGPQPRIVRFAPAAVIVEAR
jgi:hypothetical protein